MDNKQFSALDTLATQDEMVADLFVAISDLSGRKTAIEALCNELIKVVDRRAETFFTKLKPLGYKDIKSAVTAYCDEMENRFDNKED